MLRGVEKQAASISAIRPASFASAARTVKSDKSMPPSSPADE
jgi:hypothetical protein